MTTPLTTSQTNKECACAAKTKNGTPCMRNAQYGQVCWQHVQPYESYEDRWPADRS